MVETPAKENSDKKNIDVFQKEISKLFPEMKEKVLAKEKIFSKLVKVINKKAEGKVIGFYITPEIEVKNNMPTPNFDKLTLNFMLDDFEVPIPNFDPKILLQEEFEKYLVQEKKVDEYNQGYFDYFLKEDKNIQFIGTSISIMRENCFDSIYDDLKALGSSLIYQDERGFISALKTIEIHKNMLLQKFEKYIVVYAGAGSWLRGEKSNDFDVFVVVDDTDVKKMPRMQVKDQLTRIVWQMINEVAQITGIQIHAQVYLLTDFWDALKDAHPVMFTFLRDGVPFYDRGLYSAWKELLKLGKIRPSAEAIDMHMNVGTQLIDRAKKMFADIVMNDIYYSVLNPSQAILMLKGYNPTTPKETVKMFKEVLLEKENSISKKNVEILENTVRMFKKIEHDRNYEVKGAEVDKMIKDSEEYLQKIKKMFEEITEDKTKESIISAYAELTNQIRSLPGFSDLTEKDVFSNFEKDYVNNGKMPEFVKGSLKSFLKAKSDYEKGKVTLTEVNKVLKEVRNIMSEIKSIRDSALLSELSKKKFVFNYDKNKAAEMFNYNGKDFLIDLATSSTFEFNDTKFQSSKLTKDDLNDNSKFGELKINETLLKAAKETLKAEEIFL